MVEETVPYPPQKQRKKKKIPFRSKLPHANGILEEKECDVM
jgi:hypothetical protein